MRRDGDKKVLFEAHLIDPNDLVSWQTFGGARISSLYPTEVEEQ